MTLSFPVSNSTELFLNQCVGNKQRKKRVLIHDQCFNVFFFHRKSWVFTKGVVCHPRVEIRPLIEVRSDLSNSNGKDGIFFKKR